MFVEQGVSYFSFVNMLQHKFILYVQMLYCFRPSLINDFTLLNLFDTLVAEVSLVCFIARSIPVMIENT